jgi:hypothetical protein
MLLGAGFAFLLFGSIGRVATRWDRSSPTGLGHGGLGRGRFRAGCVCQWGCWWRHHPWRWGIGSMGIGVIGAAAGSTLRDGMRVRLFVTGVTVGTLTVVWGSGAVVGVTMPVTTLLSCCRART